MRVMGYSSPQGVPAPWTGAPKGDWRGGAQTSSLWASGGLTGAAAFAGVGAGPGFAGAWTGGGGGSALGDGVSGAFLQAAASRQTSRKASAEER